MSEDQENQARARAWIDEARIQLSNLKTGIEEHPVFRKQGEELARRLIAEATNFRDIASRFSRDNLEYHELLGEYNDIIDEARDLIPS
jgi:hypothetical protein